MNSVRPPEAPPSAYRTPDAFCRFGFDGDDGCSPAEAGRGELRHAGDRRIEAPIRVGRLDAIFRMNAQPDAGADREPVVCFRFLQKSAFNSSSRLGSFAARSSACEKSA